MARHSFEEPDHKRKVKRRTLRNDHPPFADSDHIVVCIEADFLRKMAQANDCRAFDDRYTDSMMDIGSRHTAAGCRNFAYRHRTARHILVEERIRYVHMVYIAFQRQEQSLCTSRGA